MSKERVEFKDRAVSGERADPMDRTDIHELLKKTRGMDALLSGIIDYLHSLRPREDYIEELVEDLQVAINNYRRRYDGDQENT